MANLTLSPRLTLKVGDVVRVGKASAINAAGELAVVVERYRNEPRFGASVSLLFRSGVHDGFPPQDLEAFDVRLVGHRPELAGYQFTSALQLRADWRGGRFAAVWGGAS